MIICKTFDFIGFFFSSQNSGKSSNYDGVKGLRRSDYKPNDFNFNNAF